MTKEDIQKNKIIYYARINPRVGIYDLCELKIRTVKDTYFVGTEKRDKHAYLLSYNSLNKYVFTDRKACLLVLNEAEKEAVKIEGEIDYEEY